MGLRRTLYGKEVLRTRRKGRFIDVQFAPARPGGRREWRSLPFEEYQRSVVKQGSEHEEQDGNDER